VRISVVKVDIPNNVKGRSAPYTAKPLKPNLSKTFKSANYTLRYDKPRPA
jgi:hypothetical protein